MHPAASFEKEVKITLQTIPTLRFRLQTKKPTVANGEALLFMNIVPISKVYIGKQTFPPLRGRTTKHYTGESFQQHGSGPRMLQRL